ncbi:Coenzyme F420 hydrogenase/dehydrogenase, beta subunit C-terminal domain [uncultured Parabacteroides sp.]|uniref:Coenzyme F420 hydrogenase/dehydrogenase, beta subunit C-terminal domain n=1 Tax=uncultured Parabacteroides sp. TaxID=512312 RepID=UPI0025868E45|nr:Coenzyme F420 hydrogenase/dehydrogenase, beta subunit C-terminal domain [uncultured Parabacteroides sp.]
MKFIELCDSNDCTGCGACYNICPKDSISMIQDEEGFLIPSIDRTVCIECALCVKVCPILNPIEKFKAVEYPIAACAKSEEIRTKSSSGGIFSLLASYVLQQEGVVFGAVMNDEFEVYHTVAHNLSELTRLRGSKYVQSDTRSTFKDVKKYLQEGRYVLYVGTPCEIAGLRKYISKSIVEKLFMVDLVCHGVPSVKAFQVYIQKYAEKKHLSLMEIQDFQFRQLDSWGITPSYKNVFGERVYTRGKDNLFMDLFLSSKLHRYSCYNCRFATEERISDITLADFWGIGSSGKLDFDISKGCSLVLANSLKGKFLMDNIKEEIYAEERTWEEAKKINHQLYKTSKRSKGREYIYLRLFEWPYDRMYDYYYNSLWFKMKKQIGRLLILLRLK